METVLRATGLCKNYGAVKALKDVSITLSQGRIVGLLGPNGSGKTTLVKLCAGLLTPTSGSLEICNKSVGPETKALVSYLPDREYFDQGKTVKQLLDLFGDFYRDFDRNRAQIMLEQLQIPVNRKFKALSKGTREKVQLVLVMSRRAKLYILDEPIAGVDPAARDYILHTIMTNFDRDATVLISTHLIADVEPVLDDFLFIHQGQVIRQGGVEQTKAEEGKSIDELFREVFRCLPSF